MLKDAGEKERNLYVNLLLKSAAKEKAYSTQLSAAASSLRYRLKNVLEPKKRISNGLILSIVLFLLAMSLGTISLADGSVSLGESIFNESKPVKLVEVTSYHLDDHSSEKLYVHGFKEKELVTYLSSLKGRKLYYGEKEEDGKSLSFSFHALSFENEKLMLFSLSDKFVTLYDPFDRFRKKTFLLDDPVDWEYLKSLLDLRAEDPNPLLHPPELKLYFGKGEQFEENALHAAKKVLFSMIGGEEKDLSTMHYEESIGGISGIPVDQVRLEFSYPPEEEYTITVNELSGSKVYSLSSQELKDHLLPLAPYSAIYKMQARFRDGSTNHLVEYSFKVELPE